MRAQACIDLVTEGVSIDDALDAYLGLAEGKGVKAKAAAKKKAKAAAKATAAAEVENEARRAGLKSGSFWNPTRQTPPPKAAHEPLFGHAELIAKARAKKGYNLLTHPKNIHQGALQGAKLGAAYGVAKELYRRRRARKRGEDREKVNLLRAAAKPALKMAGVFGAINALPFVASKTEKGSSKMREVIGKVTGAAQFK